MIEERLQFFSDLIKTRAVESNLPETPCNIHTFEGDTVFEVENDGGVSLIFTFRKDTTVTCEIALPMSHDQQLRCNGSLRGLVDDLIPIARGCWLDMTQNNVNLGYDTPEYKYKYSGFSQVIEDAIRAQAILNMLISMYDEKEAEAPELLN